MGRERSSKRRPKDVRESRRGSKSVVRGSFTEEKMFDS